MYYIPRVDIQSIMKDPLTKKTSLWCIQIVGIVLALFLPQNILEEVPTLTMFTNFMSAIVPSIDKWVNYSSFPQVTKLLFSYCWITLPFQLLIIVRHKESEMSFIKNNFANPKTKHFKPLLLIFYGGGLFLFSLFFTVPQSPPCSICTRLGQGIFAVLMVFVDACLLALIIWWLKNFRIIHLDKKGNMGDANTRSTIGDH